MSDILIANRMSDMTNHLRLEEKENQFSIKEQSYE
jgi:hypothetical protein